jgi:hypothetical protein
MRDNNWLKKQLEFLLKKYFSDVEITNSIDIRFGREAKYRFGSIRLLRGDKNKISNFKFQISNLRNKTPAKSVITITSMFAKENIPAEVVHHTICHELCHYTHGFSSTNKRLFKYPHHGGIVNKELERRGAKHLILVFKKWLKSYRSKILAGRVSI